MPLRFYSKNPKFTFIYFFNNVVNVKLVDLAYQLYLYLKTKLDDLKYHISLPNDYNL